MPISMIHNERLSDKVVHQILSMVRDGEIKPGDKLPNETLFSEQLGVSRGILREALTQLQSQGYIRRKPKDGTYIQDDVQHLLINGSMNDLMRKAAYTDLLDFRELLELRMAERVIDRATDEEIEELYDALEVAATDDDQQRSMDKYFHYRLAVASRNVFFINFIDSYYDLLSDFADHSRRDQHRRDQILAEHTAIADAIARRDKAAAAKAVRHHMRMVSRKVEAMG